MFAMFCINCFPANRYRIIVKREKKANNCDRNLSVFTSKPELSRDTLLTTSNSFISYVRITSGSSVLAISPFKDARFVILEINIKKVEREVNQKETCVQYFLGWKPVYNVNPSG